MKIAVIGDAFVDVIAGGINDLPKWGGDVECTQPIALQPGGSALNTATHLRNLSKNNPTHNLAIDLHTIIGSDAFADILKSHLKMHDIGLKHPALVNTSTGVCIVLSGPNDRGFVTDYGPVQTFSIEHVDKEDVLKANHIHIGGFYSCTTLQTQLKPFLMQARSMGITISLDTNYDRFEAWNNLEELYSLLDIFSPNEVEAMKISKKESIEDALEYFSSRVVNGITIIKVGKDGVVAKCGKTGTKYHFPSYKANVMDFTGAGDAFNAGFIYSWITNGHNTQEALSWGAATACICVESMGACSFPLSYKDVCTIRSEREVNNIENK